MGLPSIGETSRWRVYRGSTVVRQAGPGSEKSDAEELALADSGSRAAPPSRLSASKVAPIAMGLEAPARAFGVRRAKMKE
jgi:hypothetical protein